MGRQGLLFTNFRKVKSLTCSIFIVASLCCGLTACYTDDDVSLTGTSFPSGVSKEFIYNYMRLKYYYIDQDKYLDKPETYVDKVDTQKMVDLIIPWDYYDIYYMYAQMNDDFTYYLDPSRAVSLLTTMNSSEEKIGAGYTLDSLFAPNRFVIKSVEKKSPAEKAGLKAGDEIIEIEGVELKNETIFRRLAVASEGDIITFTVLRDSTKRTIPVKIAPFFTSTVEMSFADSIPVIKIHEFVSNTSNDSGTYGEFMEFLRQTDKYKTTIIDLRNNGGGDAEQCLAMTQEFLSKGDTIIGIIAANGDTVKQKQYFDTTFMVNEYDGFAKDRYFVFLANDMSASCSEIMIAGAVMNKKYPVIGTTTYGKGIGQTRIFTPSYSMASITRMQIIDKFNLSYHKYGIEPDFAIRDDAKALEKAIALAKEQDFIRVAGYGTKNTGHFAKMVVPQDTMPGFYIQPKELRKNFRISALPD